MATTIKFSRTVRQNETSKVEVPFTMTLDFTGVSQEELQRLASDKIIIARQGRARAAMNAKDNKASFAQHVKTLLDTTVSVRKYIDEARGPGKSASEKVADMFGKMDKAQREALLKQLASAK